MDIKEQLIKYGGQDWALLADAFNDSEFTKLLTQQERTILTNVNSQPRAGLQYFDYVSNILFKYISWTIYKGGKLKELAEKTENLSKHITKNQAHLNSIEKLVKVVEGASVLVAYSEKFKTTSNNHKKKAIKNFIWYVVGLFIFFLIAGATFFISISDFDRLNQLLADDVTALPLNIGFFALKATLLVFTFQIVQFFKKNYNAEKHLEEVYTHRSDVLHSLHAVYNSIDGKEEKDKILSAGALFAYERGETGYITTKEGAGSSDDIVGNIFNRITR